MDRASVLEQLSAGKISAEQAAILLGPRKNAPLPAGSVNGKRLRIRVSKLDTGRDRVNVNLPLNLVEVGLKLGAKYEPRVADLNLAEIIEAVHEGSMGKLVDVEDYSSGERVEIFID